MGCRHDPTQEEAQGGVAEEALFEQGPEGGEGTSEADAPSRLSNKYVQRS